jgi:2-polyprenyl-3-methyl-5-hydroxy-6-metoxy-1,4-benzoquinol methylase
MSYFKNRIKKFLKKYKMFRKKNQDMNAEKFTYWLGKASAASYAKNISSYPGIDAQLNKIFCDHVEKLVSKTAAVLDIGAGTGVVSLELSKRGFSVSATDISQEMLNYIKVADSSIKTYLGNIYEIQPHRKFSCVVSRWFIPHFKEWPNLIKHVSENFMNKESLFLFDLPNKLHIDFAKQFSYKISREIFGYDHDPLSPNFFFYAAADDTEIKSAASLAGLEYVKRIPHGLLKSNMILANSLGDENFIKFQKIMNEISLLDNSDLYFYTIEKYLAPLIKPEMIHGSIVVLRKN